MKIARLFGLAENHIFGKRKVSEHCRWVTVHQYCSRVKDTNDHFTLPMQKLNPLDCWTLSIESTCKEPFASMIGPNQLEFFSVSNYKINFVANNPVLQDIYTIIFEKAKIW